MKHKRPRALFLSHGGGPMPLLDDPLHREMVEKLRLIAGRISRPSAIIVVSAHWEENLPTVNASASPSLIYDYYGFPEESYDIQYPCPGEPLLAEQVRGLLNKAGIESDIDTQRGFDHGLFVPLKIIYPEADIPCIQLSLVNNLDPVEHINIGKALAGLERDDLLIIGSGFSFHNLRAFYAPSEPDSDAMNRAFEQWLMDTCTNTAVDEDERSQRLIHWSQAPFARYCHPREEHLLPLHVCYGVAQSACSECFVLTIMNKQSSMYLW
ncbi:MAG TPA: dioxygenase [Gammaproteobacteria bacterium]|nr:dioxygenase [Gammaproteobacteria bacterium]